MVNPIPNEYLIIDKRSIKDFSKVTFSTYLLKDVTNALGKSILNCKLEATINWATELLISGHSDKFWDKILNIAIKNININNPNLGVFLYSKYSKYIKLIEKTDLLSIRNNQVFRNMIAEICFIMCNSLKTKNLAFIKIKENDFNLHFLESKISANNPDVVTDKLKYGDPPETKLVLNEFNYCLVNKNYELCVYWLSWIFEWEKKNTKKDKMYICGLREINNVNKKYYNDLVWLVWEIILKEGVKIDNDFLNLNIQSLYKLYKFNFKPSKKAKKSFIFLFAIKYFTDNFHVNKQIHNYHILVQSCLNINNIFYEKNKIAENNNIDTDIYKYKNNVSNIKQDLKQDKIKKERQMEKKKLVELKKIAETKMKLKISKLEEIDSIILSKYK